jgi:hypothetical protein
VPFIDTAVRIADSVLAVSFSIVASNLGTPAMGDYRDIRSIAVHAADVVTAVEANRTGESQTVLRVTPPFSGRMRARLHVEQAAGYEDANPEPLHIDPARLVDASPHPTPDETEERLRADSGTEYTVETHHEWHTVAVENWREELTNSVVESFELTGQYGPHRVGVAALG